MRLLSRNQNAPLSKLDVRLKMCLGFCMSILAVLVDSPAFLGGLAVAGLGFFVLGGPNRSQVKLVSLTCSLMVWGLMFSQALFYDRFPRQAILVISEPNWLFADGLKVFLQGVHHGMLQSLRMVAMTLTGYAICFSTEPDRFLHGLQSIRIPFSLAFMAVSAIRFIPVVLEEWTTVRAAMRLKGYRPLKPGILTTIRVEVQSLRPVLTATIRRSEELALSIQTRGFSIGARRTCLYQERFSAKHWAALTALTVLVLGVTTCKLLFWLYQHQLVYAPGLRPIYFFTRKWL